MTHEEVYQDGWHKGRRFAESDLRDGFTSDGTVRLFREFAEQTNSREARAYWLGAARGYRDTVARFDAGELTWEMFDQPPLGT